MGDWLAGSPLPEEANHAWLALLAKGLDSATGLPGFRPLQDTRPLSLGNTDVEIIASAVNHLLEPAVSQWAANAQRGFIQGRQMLDNVLE
eukprot:6066400-Pyramimonas_sp.AAC.1